MVKAYWTIWAAILIGAMALFVTGNLTAVVVVALGFISFGMIFMGMMAVLPSTISHPSPARTHSNLSVSAYTQRLKGSIHALRSGPSRWLHTDDMAVRKPTYR